MPSASEAARLRVAAKMAEADRLYFARREAAVDAIVAGLPDKYRKEYLPNGEAVAVDFRTLRIATGNPNA